MILLREFNLLIVIIIINKYINNINNKVNIVNQVDKPVLHNLILYLDRNNNKIKIYKYNKYNK